MPCRGQVEPAPATYILREIGKMHGRVERKVEEKRGSESDVVFGHADGRSILHFKRGIQMKSPEAPKAPSEMGG